MSGGIAYVAAVVLCVVLVWAAVAKLLRPGAAAAAFAELGLPLARPLAVAVPVAELGVGGLLLLRPQVGGLTALGLLAAFSVVLVLQLRGGSPTACGCFGSTGTGLISGVDLVRNGLLGCAAAAALSQSRPVVPMLAEVIVVTVAAASATVVVALLALRRQAGAIWNTRGEVA